LDKGSQPFILLRSAQELERNPSSADGTNNGCRLDRGLILGKDDLEVKNIINPHMSLTLDNAAP
jgi:hypothetical protein